MHIEGTLSPLLPAVSLRGTGRTSGYPTPRLQLQPAWSKGKAPTCPSASKEPLPAPCHLRTAGWSPFSSLFSQTRRCSQFTLPVHPPSGSLRSRPLVPSLLLHSSSFLRFPSHSHPLEVWSLIVLALSSPFLTGLLPFSSTSSLHSLDCSAFHAWHFCTSPAFFPALHSPPLRFPIPPRAGRLPRNRRLSLRTGPARSQGLPTQHCSGLPLPLKEIPGDFLGWSPYRGTLLASGATQLSGTTGLY